MSKFFYGHSTKKQIASSLNQVRNFRPSGLNRASSQMETKTEVGSRNSLLPSLFSVVSAFHFDGHFTVVIIIALCNSCPNFLKTMSHMLFFILVSDYTQLELSFLRCLFQLTNRNLFRAAF